MDLSNTLVDGFTYRDLLVVGLVISLGVLIFIISASVRLIKSSIRIHADLAKKRSAKAKGLLMLLGFMSIADSVWAGTEESTDVLSAFLTLDTFLIALLIVIWLMIISFIIIMNRTLSALKDRIRFHAHLENGGTEEEYYASQTDIVDTLTAGLTDAVAIEEEESILMNHEYDGIRELDNNLPPWWKYMFYVTIVIAGIYIYHYHFGTGPSSDEEWKMEMTELQKIKDAYLEREANKVNEKTVTVDLSPSTLENGKKIFTQSCASCHGALGEGGAGPNFTDKYWIYGGDIKDIFKTAKYGTGKGMPKWSEQLKPSELSNVANFIYSLEGTNPPGAKPPQGTLYERK